MHPRACTWPGLTHLAACLEQASFSSSSACHHRRQPCAGQLSRLDLAGFDLRCEWSRVAGSIAQLSSLVTLDLSGNLSLTGRVAVLVDADVQTRVPCIVMDVVYLDAPPRPKRRATMPAL